MKTDAGKAKSRFNALKTGIWATHPIAIGSGPFKEDPEAVEALRSEIIDALGPRDATEFHVARQVAHAMLLSERLERLQTSS